MIFIPYCKTSETLFIKFAVCDSYIIIIIIHQMAMHKLVLGSVQ